MKEKSYVSLPPDQDPKAFGLFTRKADFYRTFFPMLFIIVLQQVAALTVNLVDNLMLGRYTELALAGATLVNQIQFSLQQIASGIGIGVVVLASQYWGQHRTQPIKQIINIGLKLGFAVGVLFLVLTKLFPLQILAIFANDAAVIAEGARYLHVICWTYVIFAVSNSLMYALQSVETVMIGTIMSISTICINACLNYCLIFGNFGLPELGIVGAAVATLVSRIVELIIILIYVLLIDKKLHTKFSELVCIDWTYLKDYIKVAMPMVINLTLWGVAQAAQAAILGHINATVIAANSIAIVIFQIFAVVGMSSGNVSSVVVGKTIGEGQLHLVRSYSKTMQGIYLIIGLVFGGLMFLLKGPIVGIYTVSAETKELAIAFLTVLSITSVGTCYEYPVAYGIIAGGGVTKYAAIVDNLFMWLFTIPSAFLSAFVFQWSPIVTFAFLKADQILKCIPHFIVCNRYRWVRILTRDTVPSEQG